MYHHEQPHRDLHSPGSIETCDVSPALKRRWFRQARRSKHPNDWLRYKALKKQAQKTCQETHDQYTNDMLTNDNKNPKRFWNFIKSRKKDSTGVAPLKRGGLTFSDSLNKAHIMGDQFCSVFTQADTSELPDLGPSQTPSVPPITVNIKGVQKLLKDIKPHKATGPDNVAERSRRRISSRPGPPLPDLNRQWQDPNGLEISPRHPGLQEGKSFNSIQLQANLPYANRMKNPGTRHPLKRHEKNSILTDGQHGFRTHRLPARLS